MRRQRGQTSVEYLGVILVVVVLISGLVRGAEPVAAAVTSGVRCAIATLDGGGDCGGGESPAPDAEEPGAPSPSDPDGGPDGGPSEGPPLDESAGFPIPGLPWDGSLSVEGDGKGAGDFEGLYGEVSITAEQRPCRYDAEGRPTVTLSVSGELDVGTGVEGERGSTEVDLEEYAGMRLSYEINTDPETAEAIRDGAAPPNPIDPTSIPPGSSIVLNQDTYAGLDLSASYDAIRASFGYEEGRRVSSAVERVDEDTVRVTVGDADLVAETIALGIGTEDVNVGLVAKEELTSGQTRQVDIDISTPAGREAYAQFVATGELPAEGSAGVSDASASEVINYSSSTSLGGRLGPFQATVFASDGAGQIIDTTNPDGSHTSTQFAREGGVSFTRTVQTDAAGDRVGEEEYVLRMQDVDGSFIDGLNQLHGADPDPDIATQDVTMSFTGDELEEMQRRALDQLVADYRNEGLSREDIVERLEEDDVYAQVAGDPTTIAIAAASEPAEVAQALLRRARGSGSALVDYLLNFEKNPNVDEEDDPVVPPPGLGGPSC